MRGLWVYIFDCLRKIYSLCSDDIVLCKYYSYGIMIWGILHNMAYPYEITTSKLASVHNYDDVHYHMQ